MEVRLIIAMVQHCKGFQCSIDYYDLKNFHRTDKAQSQAGIYAKEILPGFTSFAGQ